MKLQFGHDKHKSRLPVMTLQLLPTEQPPKSKIKLTKNQSSLLICISPVGFHQVLIPFVVFAIIWNGLLLLMTIEAFRIPSANHWGLAAFSIPFWAIGLFIVYGCLFISYSSTQLKIENQTVEHGQFLFGRRIGGRKTIARSEIYKLAFTPNCFSYDSDSVRQEQPAQLQIDAGSQEIVLGGIGGGIKTEAEIEWLAYEISDWLDIPLKIIDSVSEYGAHSIEPNDTPKELQYLSTDSIQFQVQYGDKTKIDKTSSSLSLDISSSLSRSSLYFVLIFTLVWCGALWTIFCHDPIFSIPFVCFEILLILTSGCLLFAYYSRLYLHVENQTISFSQTLYGRPFGTPKNLHRNEIPQLTVTCKHWQYSIDRSSRREQPTQLLINFKDKQINLGGIGNEAEVIWLATEISELLDISLEIIRPS
jgi:hypothetical protein